MKNWIYLCSFKQRYIAGSAKCSTKPLSKLFPCVISTSKPGFRVIVTLAIRGVVWIRCRHFPVLSSFMTYHRVSNFNTTGATSGAGTAYHSGAPEFIPVFSGVRVTRSLVLCVCFVDRCLSFCTFSFGIAFFSDIRILVSSNSSHNGKRLWNSILQ